MHQLIKSSWPSGSAASTRVGTPRVHRALCAVDCGTAVNFGATAKQEEGAGILCRWQRFTNRSISTTELCNRRIFANPIIGMARASPSLLSWLSGTRGPAVSVTHRCGAFASAMGNALLTPAGNEPLNPALSPAKAPPATALNESLVKKGDSAWTAKNCGAIVALRHPKGGKADCVGAVP